MSPQIGDYYRWAVETLRSEVAATPEREALSLDTESWVEHLITRYGMQEIRADFDAVKMEEVVNSNGHLLMLLTVPVEPSDTFDVIAKEALTGQGGWFGFDYRTFFSDQRPYTLGQAEPQDANAIKAAKQRIMDYVVSLNNAIYHENTTFGDQVRQVVNRRLANIEKKNKHLGELSATVGIPLVQRAEMSTVIPTALRVKKTIAPLMRKTEAEQRLVLEPDKLNSIMELIDNQCRAFERTPTAYQAMGEEALRDIILSSLNGVFAGAATGEAFSVLGKTDIHLRISKGELFIAEIKVWSGRASLAEVVGQLLERLTWREAFGVAVMFSRNADFGAVQKTVETEMPNLARAVAGTFKTAARNHIVGRFVLPSDASTQVEIHTVVYNLYTERPSGRTS